MKIIYTKSITKDVLKIKDKKLILKTEQLISELKNAETIVEIKAAKKLSGHPCLPDENRKLSFRFLLSK